MSGAEKITEERNRQVHEEGYTQEHDAYHAPGELTVAAIVYLRCALTHYAPSNPNAAPAVNDPPTDWPWPDGFKPDWNDPVRNLVRAGALVAAEIDRLMVQRQGMAWRGITDTEVVVP